MARVNPKSWQIEAQFVPGDLEEAFDLRRRLIDAGESPAAASGLVGWLIEKKVTGQDESAQATRVRYRKTLAKLPLSSPPAGGDSLPRRNSGIAPLPLVAA